MNHGISVVQLENKLEVQDGATYYTNDEFARAAASASESLAGCRQWATGEKSEARPREKTRDGADSSSEATRAALPVARRSGTYLR